MNTDDSRTGGNDRRHFLKCMTWAGTAMVWSVAGGIPRSRLIGSAEAATSTRIQLRADQRQPSGLRQGGQSEHHGDVAGGAERRRRPAGHAGFHDPHRRYFPSVEAGAVRHRRNSSWGRPS